MDIKINKEYLYFDDGKIKPSRKYNVIITKIVPFNEIDSETGNQWGEEVMECDSLYKNSTDYFIFGNLELHDLSFEEIVFVRTIDNGWFSLGWWGGRLDADGKLLAQMNENMKFWSKS